MAQILTLLYSTVAEQCPIVAVVVVDVADTAAGCNEVGSEQVCGTGFDDYFAQNDPLEVGVGVVAVGGAVVDHSRSNSHPPRTIRQH